MLSQRSLKVMGLALVGSIGALAVRCGGDDASSAGGGGGGGSTGTGGTATGGGGGTSATGGGGTGGAIITDGGGDSGLPAECTTQTPLMCTAIAPLSATIADFTAPEAGLRASCSGTEGPVAYGPYGDDLFGGTYVYPNYAMMDLPNDAGTCVPMCTPTMALSLFPLRQDLSGGSWHITGNVGDYSGFGIYVNRKTGPGPTEGTFAYSGVPYHVIDASAYSGISFTISGSVGTPSTVFVNMSSAATTVSTTSAGFTTCGTCPVAPCGNIEVPVTVTSTPTPVTVTFAQAGITDPAAFMTFSWRFNNPAGVGLPTATTYPVDVVVDDVRFASP